MNRISRLVFIACEVSKNNKKEALSAGKNLCSLWQTFFLEEKMGKSMG
jgi:hypothetical protein